MKTALITGASSGIGAAFARALAPQGYSLVLVARREDRLRVLADELRDRHDVSVDVLAADLARPEGVERVEEKIRALDNLSLLINNAGFGSGGAFHSIDISKQMDMVHVHVIATARLTRAALPQMVARRDGAIINVSSVAAYATVPTGAMYGSTKAWMLSFTKAIAQELRGTGVRAQALCPGFTYTEFHDTPEYQDFDRSVIPRFMWMSSAAVVAASLSALRRDRVVCIPGLKNQFLVALLHFPPAMALARRFGKRRWKQG
jgi:uncharacterized protein